jgi:hypothetical protein
MHDKKIKKVGNRFAEYARATRKAVAMIVQHRQAVVSMS